MPWTLASTKRVVRKNARTGNEQCRRSRVPEHTSNSSGVIEQEVVPAHQDDLDVRPPLAEPFQVAGGVDPPEAAAEDHDASLPGGLHRSMHVRDWTPAAAERLLAGGSSKSGRRRRPTFPAVTVPGREGAAMSDQHGPEGHHPGRSHVTLQAMRSHVQPGSFPLLLVASRAPLRAERAGGRLASEWDSRSCRCGVRGPLRAEREPDHALARGSRRRALDHVRSPLVGARSAGQPGVAGCDGDRLSPLGPRRRASRGLPPPHDGAGRGRRGAVRLPAHPHGVHACARPDRGVAPGLVSHGRSAVVRALGRDAASPASSTSAPSPSPRSGSATSFPSRRPRGS